LQVRLSSVAGDLELGLQRRWSQQTVGYMGAVVGLQVGGPHVHGMG
jgi:hypothetical protein